MSRGGSLALALALALGAGSAASAQEDPDEPAKTDEKSPRDAKAPEGRVPFKREQGSSEALAAELKQLLTDLGKRYPELPYPAAGAASASGQFGGLKAPSPAPEVRPPQDRAEQERQDPLLARLSAWRPTKAALGDVLSEEGVRAIGKAIYVRGRARFRAGDPGLIARELGLHPSMSEVQVFSASTEELATMESGTVAAREFASGLRGMTQFLKPRYQFYVVVLNRPEAAKAKQPKPKDALDPADARLQLFVHSGKGFVYLGRIWRLEGRLARPQPTPPPGK